MVREHQTELDSHADTCCVGDYTVILSSFGNCTVEVTPILNALGTLPSICICSAAIAYDDPKTGTATLIIVHQAFHILGLDHNLLCPMQLRHAGIIVNDHPKHCSPEWTGDNHALVVPDPDGSDDFCISRGDVLLCHPHSYCR